MTVTCYTDGSCLGNPGPGGWAWIRTDDGTRHASGSKRSTNNIMEMTAVIECIKKHVNQNIIIYTDSKYVKDGVETWSKKWVKNGFKTSQGKAVKNDKLWKELLGLVGSNSVTFNWVKGHSKDVWNERVDNLARDAALHQSSAISS